MSRPAAAPAAPPVLSAAAAIDAARNGRILVLVDDEAADGSADLMLPAQMATPDAMAFMTGGSGGRGPLCLALTRQRAEQLELPVRSGGHLADGRLVGEAADRAERPAAATALAIRARHAAPGESQAAMPDAARTIAVAIDPMTRPADLVSPGHVHPLTASDGGVLVRAGRAEAAVDMARLAGLNPSAVLCQVLAGDGRPAQRADVLAFAAANGLGIATIAGLIAHRRRHDRIVERRLSAPFDSAIGGRFMLHLYVNTVSYAEHVALVKGDVAGDEPVLVRMHAVNVLSDVLGGTAGGPPILHQAMRLIAEAGRGVVVLIREARPTSLSDRIARLPGLADGHGTGEAAGAGANDSAGDAATRPGAAEELRDYGVGAQVLLDLGVRHMILLSNRPRSFVGLDGYGLTVHEQRPVPAGAGPSF
ncbi:MAG: 3,4-dihydroxy-2-butanone-4-phosphate synthase [Alphaproteobacteria bacterium]